MQLIMTILLSKTGVESYATMLNPFSPEYYTRFSFTRPFSTPTPQSHSHAALLFARSSFLLVRNRLTDVETQSCRIQIHLILTLLQDLCNVLRILKLPEIDIGPRLLDGITNELG